MSVLQNKIDFAAIISVTCANINGDPLMVTAPEKTMTGMVFSQMWQLNASFAIVFRIWASAFLSSQMNVQMMANKSLKDRAESCLEFKAEISKGKKADKNKCAQIACREWFDVRAFGQVFAFKGDEVSIGIRNPVSIQQALSVYRLIL